MEQAGISSTHCTRTHNSDTIDLLHLQSLSSKVIYRYSLLDRQLNRATRHAGLDPASSPHIWIPAFAGMTTLKHLLAGVITIAHRSSAIEFLMTAKMSEKAVTVVVCVTGVLAVAYGMIRPNHVAFIVGLVLVVGGYLRIRKKLKESLRKKE
jgi:hypothetical protein